jgi:hypothetical protein
MILFFFTTQISIFIKTLDLFILLILRKKRTEMEIGKKLDRIANLLENLGHRKRARL